MRDVTIVGRIMEIGAEIRRRLLPELHFHFWFLQRGVSLGYNGLDLQLVWFWLLRFSMEFLVVVEF